MVMGILYALAALVAVLAVVVGIVIAAVLYRFPGKYLDADGVRLFYREEGSGVPVILVHGYGVNADLNWRYPGVVRALRSEYRVITLDVRGHGRSDKPHTPEKYGMEIVRDVIRLMDHLGIEKAHVVGYSMGGFITIKLTSAYPDRLLSAVPCASGFERPEGEKLGLLKELTEFLDREGSYGPLVRFLEPGVPPEWRVKLVDFLLSAINDNQALSALMKVFADLAITEEDLRNNRVPVLSIVGTRDPLGAGVKEMVEMMAHHEAVYIEGGDHLTTLLNKKYVENVKAFLAKHTPAEETGPAA